MMSLIKKWLPVILWMGIIFFASSRHNPYSYLPSAWQSKCRPAAIAIGISPEICQDEVIGNISHFSEYLILAVLVFRAKGGKLAYQNSKTAPFLAIVIGITFFYGLTDEFHQLFVPGRTFQISDLALDLSGALMGAGICWYSIQRGLKKSIQIRKNSTKVRG